MIRHVACRYFLPWVVCYSHLPYFLMEELLQSNLFILLYFLQCCDHLEIENSANTGTLTGHATHFF